MNSSEELVRIATEAVAIAAESFSDDETRCLVAHERGFRKDMERAVANIMTKMRRLEEMASQRSQHYPPNYVPVRFDDQIDVLRGFWPSLNPDRALRYVHGVYPSLAHPAWVEGPFALIRHGFFSNRYEEEAREVINIVRRLHPDMRGYPRLFGLCEHTQDMMRLLCDAQPDSDILVVGCQFGLRHDASGSVKDNPEKYVHGEFGLGVKDVMTMLLTAPLRTPEQHGLWLDCPGERARTCLITRPLGGTELGSGTIESSPSDYGQVTGFLPQK